MPGPLYRPQRRAHRPRPTPGSCGKIEHPDPESAVVHMLSLIRSGKHRPERGPLRYYFCPDCWSYHVGHKAGR